MIRGIRYLSRAIALATLLMAGMIPPSTAARTPETSEAPEAITRNEVRLRKLHLVRPDLIPYPIHYDVYC